MLPVIFTDCLDINQAGGTVFTPLQALASYDYIPDVQENLLSLKVVGQMTQGTITDLDDRTNRYTTLRIESEVLEFTVYNDYTRFCNVITNSSGCPIYQDEIFGFGYQFNVSDAYQGVSFETTFYIIDDSPGENIVGCLTVEVSPKLRKSVVLSLLCGVIAVVVLLILAHILSMIFNPWTGTKNIYLSTSNYGRNANAIRLITPGVLDFIHYLQMAVLLGCLNLNYPGFFQPVLATAAWTCLLFDIGVVSQIIEKLPSNIYPETDKFGFSTMLRALRMISDKNAWPGFIIWLIAIAVGIVLLWLSVVFGHWIYCRRTQKSTNFIWNHGVHFIGGALLRLVFNIFSLPLLTIAMFQIAIIPGQNPPVVADVFAVVAIIGWVGGAIAISFKLMTYSPRHGLFTELPTLLLLGPLYNTYQESQLGIVIVELLATVVRAIAIGALQLSGVAQLSVLIVVELTCFIGILIIRPFEPATGMNLVMTVMATIRLIVVFLLIPLVPSLHAGPVLRGWFAYATLLIHLLVIVLFVVHVVQVVFEILIRLSGAGVTNDSDLESKETGYGINTYQEMGHGYDGRLLLRQESTDEVKLDSRRHSHRTSLNRNRNSTVEGQLVSSPVSEISSPPMSANPNNVSSFGYYRRPRRRQSSHDWQFDFSDDTKTPLQEEEVSNSSGAATVPTTPGGGSGATGRRSVDYAVREADMYITKRSRTSSLFYSDDDEFHDAESQMKRYSTTISPIKEPNENNEYFESEKEEDVEIVNHKNISRSESEGRILGPMKVLMTKVASNFSSNKNKVKEDSFEPRGFQVLNRQPIVPTVRKEAINLRTLTTVGGKTEYLGDERCGDEKGGESNETDDLLGCEARHSSDTETLSGAGQKPSSIFRVPRPTRSISTGLRVDTTSSFKEGE